MILRLQNSPATESFAMMPAKTNLPKSQAVELHYHGHRERLRGRFHGAGPDAPSDYELLEMAVRAT